MTDFWSSACFPKIGSYVLGKVMLAVSVQISIAGYNKTQDYGVYFRKK
jgi:hypothetical protein